MTFPQHEPGAGSPARSRPYVRLMTALGTLGLVAGVVGALVGFNTDPVFSLPEKMPTMPSRPGMPSGLPTDFPTNMPTGFPTDLPTNFPTEMPSGLPTDVPDLPTELPSGFPTGMPSGFPTDLPTNLPTDWPGGTP